MRVLVVGGGGREHALCWKLKQSAHEIELFCAPGSPGIAELGACVPVPIPVKPDVAEVGTLVPTPDIYLAAEPAALHEELARRVQKKNRHIEVVAPLDFCDAAFPEGGSRLADLLAADGDLTDVLGVRYLAVVEEISATASDAGFMTSTLPLFPGALGAVSYSNRIVMTALVIDLASRSRVAYRRLEGEGRGFGVSLLVYGVFTIPMTWRGIKNGIAGVIAEAVASEAGGQPVRIAILGAGDADEANGPDDRTGDCNIHPGIE